jgi:hypothetical protein
MTDQKPTNASPPSGVSRRNLRRCRRQAPKGSTRVKAYRNGLGLGRPISDGVLDISEVGARLLLTVELPVGAEFLIEFESAASRLVKMLANVMWIVAAADGRFVVGVRFQKALPYVDLHALARP